MFRLGLVLLGLAMCSLAQTPADLFNKPPEDVDRALRGRISEFYQDHVEGKFRQAETLVAEDTKEFFYDSNKPKYLGFEIERIEYSDNFTHAKATVLCEQFVMIPGFADKPLKVPTPSTWKLVDGQWYWYVDQSKGRETPFGIEKPPAEGAPARAGGLPTIPKPEQMKFIFSQVKADKQGVTLKPGNSEQVTITNTAQGTMSISLIGTVPGVEVKLDHMDLKAGEKAVLTFRAGNDAKSGVVSVRVEQTNQVIPIQVTIQ